MWPIAFFAKLLVAVGRNARLIAIIVGFLSWVVGVINLVVTGAVALISQLLATLSTAGLGGVNLATAEYIGYANAIMPISEMVALLGIYTAAVATITLIRWIKSFVPTIAN